MNIQEPRDRCRRRLALLVATFATGLCAFDIFIEPHIAYNHTASMPRGFYWTADIPPKGLRRGDLVIACAPPVFARFGYARGFLDVGTCGGVTTLLKCVAAIARDHVRVNERGVRVNGHLIAHSRPLTVDFPGASLAHRAFGDYRLSENDVWIGAIDPRSFDSRYFGPVHTIRAIARPLLLFDGALPWSPCSAITSTSFTKAPS